MSFEQKYFYGELKASGDDRRRDFLSFITRLIVFSIAPNFFFSLYTR